MKLDNRNNTFTIKEAIKSIVYQLRICKQKTTNVTPFQAHFGRKPNTPLNNISTIPKSSNLSYENNVRHYLDADTVPVEDFLDDNGCDRRSQRHFDRRGNAKDPGRCRTQIQWGQKQIGIPIYNTPQTKRPNTTNGEIVGHQAGPQSVQKIKEGSPRSLGNIGPV